MEALILGVGNCKERRICPPDRARDFSDVNLTTVDIDPNCNPTHVLDMDAICALPFMPETFDEIHAYDSLEHWGTQGDWRGYFDEFERYHTILKPDGCMYIIVPYTTDYFADPGHKRFFSMNHFAMLDQRFYKHSLENNLNVTDYRFYWKKHLEVIFNKVTPDHIAVILQKKEYSDGE